MINLAIRAGHFFFSMDLLLAKNTFKSSQNEVEFAMQFQRTKKTFQKTVECLLNFKKILFLIYFGGFVIMLIRVDKS